MSLKGVHLVVITFSIALVSFMLVWAVRYFLSTHETQYLLMAIAMFVAALFLIPYLVWFFAKLRQGRFS